MHNFELLGGWASMHLSLERKIRSSYLKPVKMETVQLRLAIATFLQNELWILQVQQRKDGTCKLITCFLMQLSPKYSAQLI